MLARSRKLESSVWKVSLLKVSHGTEAAQPGKSHSKVGAERTCSERGEASNASKITRSPSVLEIRPYQRMNDSGGWSVDGRARDLPMFSPDKQASVLLRDM
jgi:hypothetical protein